MDAIADFLATYSTTFAIVGINALLALSVWLTLYAGQLTLGNAAFMAIGAYTSALLGRHLGAPFPLALAAGAVAAGSQGIAVRRYKLAAFVLGALLAAWAGGLSAHVTFSIDPNDFAFTKAVQILVFAVVGGTPNVVGPILGATVFTALPELLRPFKDYRDIFQGAILLAVIIYLPRGIVTLAELRKTRRLAEIGAADVA